MPLTPIVHIPNPSIAQVRVSAGEFLTFQIDAGGPVPLFTQSGSISGVIMHESRFPSVQRRYVWNYLRSATDQHNFEVVTTGLQFFNNADYRLVVTLSDATQRPVRTVLDLEWTGGSPGQFTNESLTLVLS